MNIISYYIVNNVLRKTNDVFFSICNVCIKTLYTFISILPESIPLHYFYLVIIFTILFIFFYIKIKYPFWNIQPVFHTYDFWRYYTSSPFLIQNNGPLRTKYCKFDNVKTIPFTESNYNDKCIDLLQSHYISSDKILFTITNNTLSSHMAGTDGAPFVSIYFDKHYEFIKDTGGDSHNENYLLSYVNHPIACMFSKPITIFILQRNKNNYNMIKKFAYLWDFICVHREHKKYNISRNIIQTHEYNQRIKSPDIPISIFKKEVDLCKGIVPITQYKTHYYYIHPLRLQRLPEHFTIIRIYKENIDLLFDFFSGINNYHLFNFAAIPSISNLTSLIINHELYVFCLSRREHIFGFYFLKDMHMNYEDIENVTTNTQKISGNSIQLIASINNSTSNNVFVSGFLHSLRIMLKMKYKSFKIIAIDECSHNYFIKTAIDRLFFHIYSNDSAYYFYNYVCPNIPLKSENCLFVL
jgi:hypothetical protein